MGSKSKAMNWGRQTVKVKIFNKYSYLDGSQFSLLRLTFYFSKHN